MGNSWAYGANSRIPEDAMHRTSDVIQAWAEQWVSGCAVGTSAGSVGRVTSI